MAKRARVHKPGSRKSAGRKPKRRAPKSALPVGSARPATPLKYAHLSVYDPTTKQVLGETPPNPEQAQDTGAADAATRAGSPSSFPSRGFFLQIPHGSDCYREHLGGACPYCIAPGWVQEKGWPPPLQCHVWVASNVMCCDTTSAAQGQHHYHCFYWEHVENATPF